jgi:seryl-tRNA synthetase
MHDLRFIRDNPEAFDNALKRRNGMGYSQKILALDEKHRAAQTHLQHLQKRRNDVAKAFGMAKAKGEDTDAFSKEAEDIKDNISLTSAEEQSLSQELKDLMDHIPNLPQKDVPEGKSEKDNVCVRHVGQTPTFDFPPKEHFDLGESLGQIDFEGAVKLSGSRFVLLTHHIAQLERALASFMLDIHTQEFGFMEVSPPLMAHSETMYNTGLLPKFKDDLFQTTRGDWLIPTSEAVLSNMVAGEIMDSESLPLRLTAYTPCFRSEAGSAGRDTRGMIRLHQFNKVELVSITTADQSLQEHEHMLHAAETILKRLDLPYRVMLLCTGDMGFQSSKTYDIEVWLPGQGAYREISSVSNCLDFQARRMKARYRTAAGDKKTHFAHTLNGSGLAVGRTLVAVLENYQNSDGSITVPKVLQPYMRNLHVINKKD